ncbi:MAG: alcohol dehydrogenase [Phycisphaerae bacterium]
MSAKPTMPALVFEGPDRLRLREWPRPEPGPGEVLIRVGAATICGTDVRIVAGRKTRDVRIGHPIGHECAGTVAAVGPGVGGYAPGDRVGLCPVVSCGRCEYCRADHENLCATRITLGYHTDGSFAEYMLIPALAVARGNLFKLPASVSFEAAALLEPLGCCINGQHEMGLGELTSGDDGRRLRLVIFGAGPIGLMHLLLAKARRGGTPRADAPAAESAFEVVVVERLEHRRQAALRLGADAACPPEDFNAEGEFDAAVIAVGVTELVPTALRALRKGGRLNLFAGFDAGAVAAIDPNAIHYRQLTVTGASESRRRDYAEGLALLSAGRIRLDPLVTHRFALADHEAAFRTAADGSAIKVAFSP